MEEEGSVSEKQPDVASSASRPPVRDPSSTHPLGSLQTTRNASANPLQDAPATYGNPGTDSDQEDGRVRERRDLARQQPERFDLSIQKNDFPGTQERRGYNPFENDAAEADEAAQYVPTKGDISLREWLDKPDRQIEPLECLHVFKQIVDMVAAAHAQGIVVANVRPSCFVLSIFNRISFIESASCSSGSSSSGSDSCNDVGSEPNDGIEVPPKTGSGAATWLSSSPELELERGGRESAGGGEDANAYGCGVSGESEKSISFPLKQILLREYNWYTSPEEAAGGSPSFASDIYKLGVLLFELLSMFGSLDEKLTTMSNLRHRVLPPQLLLKWPKEASFCMWLLHPQPSARPKMDEVLKSEFLNESRENLEEREAAAKLREDIHDQELLLEFLLMLQRGKQETSEKLTGLIHHISSDVEDVTQKLILTKDVCFLDSEVDKQSTLEKDIQLASCSSGQDASYLTRKRFRPGLRKTGKEWSSHVIEGLRSKMQPKAREVLLSKSSRLMKNFSKLESAYMLTRYQTRQPAAQIQSSNLLVNSAVKGSVSRTEGSSVDNCTVKEIPSGRRNKWLNPFLEGLYKYLSFSDLKVRANLKQGDLLNPSSLVCSIGFDRDKELFATAGVNRKIKIFECDAILNEDRDIHYPVVEMVSRSKLSSICWNSYIRSQIASSDFDGVVQVWDVRRGQVIMDLREHERPVWCIDFSQADPTKLASGSDDRTVKLWNINQAGSLGTIKTKANVCSVQFPPGSGYSIAIGSADHHIYCYDLRNLKTPSCTLVGHRKTVSYVRFIDSSTLVSASTDSSLKLWDLSSTNSRMHDNSLLTFTGHTNVKNFVGLSTYDGYIAAGSETNEVFVYHRALPMPVLSSKFGTLDPISGQEDDANQFISSLCWRGRSYPHILIAANSSGNIKLLEMV